MPSEPPDVSLPSPDVPPSVPSEPVSVPVSVPPSVPPVDPSVGVSVSGSVPVVLSGVEPSVGSSVVPSVVPVVDSSEPRSPVPVPESSPGTFAGSSAGLVGVGTVVESSESCDVRLMLVPEPSWPRTASDSGLPMTSSTTSTTPMTTTNSAAADSASTFLVPCFSTKRSQALRGSGSSPSGTSPSGTSPSGAPPSDPSPSSAASAASEVPTGPRGRVPPSGAVASSGCVPGTVPSVSVSVTDRRSTVGAPSPPTGASAASDVLTTVPRAVVAVPLTRSAAVRDRAEAGPVRATTLVTTGLSCSCVFSIERV